MSGHVAWLVGEIVGGGIVAMAVVLMGLLAIAAALHAGRTPAPVPEHPADPFEAIVLERYARGEIGAAECQAVLQQRRPNAVR